MLINPFYFTIFSEICTSEYEKPHKVFCLMRCKFFKISQNAVSRILSPSRARGATAGTISVFRSIMTA